MIKFKFELFSPEGDKNQTQEKKSQNKTHKTKTAQQTKMNHYNIEDTNIKQKVYIDPAIRNQLVEIPPNAPEWKKALLQRKNKSIIDKAVREAEERKDPYEGVPEWKKALLRKRDQIENEKKVRKQEEEKRREENANKFNTNPIWRKELIIKKHSGNKQKNIEDYRK